MWIISIALLVSFVPSEGALNEILERCCTVGARLAKSEDGCDSYESVPIRDVVQGDQMSCRSIIEVCCLKQKHIDQCVIGKQDSLNGRACSIRSDAYGAEQYKECCQCCKLGLVAKTANLPCDLTSIGGPCDQVFKECCMGQSDPSPQEDDKDECALYAGQLCSHDCINTIGSFKCGCPSGYELDEGGRTCKKQAEGSQCSVNNPCDQRCVDVEQRATCSCFDGYELRRDQRSCKDVDECTTGTGVCPLGQYCVNKEGSYTCKRNLDTSCPAGFTYNPSTLRCEANLPTQCPSGQVYNTITRRCEDNTNKQCSTGYALNVVNGQCEDVDECALGNHNCHGARQKCHNTQGGFLCQCQPGFQFNPSRRICEDINECARNYDNCVGEQRCENTIGSYVCRRIKGCGTGYTLDDRSQTCIDVDECTVGTHNCGTGYNCRNLEGSFRCEVKTCPEGYRINFSSGQCEVIVCAPGHRIDRTGNCIDINECIENPNICGGRSKRCINSLGSYSCQNLVNCPEGYELKGAGKRCEDIDECSLGTHTCLPTQECRNRPGTFLCQCPDGYESSGGPGGRCEDINECLRYSNQVCASNSECQNTQGSYRCVCKDGFQTGQDGRTCTDIDECQDQYRCEHECINTYGSFHCLCNDGYKLAADKRRCEDIDECNFYAGRGRLCIGKCTNIPGSYTCSCPDGYRLIGDQRTCQDVDECAEGSHRCPANAVCTNTRGSHKCQDINCPKGFYRASSFTRGKSVRCQRKTFVCSSGDTECLSNTLLSYSYNFLTFPTKIRIPADLFTMSGPQTEFRRMEFDLKLQSARELTAGIRRATRDMFELRKLTTNKAVVRILREVPGPQDVELELDMHIYGPDNTFFGTAKAKIFLTTAGVITDDELVCIREKCQVLDVDCIVNTTKSVSWQHLTLPTVEFLPRPVTLVNVQTVGVSADPNLELNILEGNEVNLFDVKTHKDRGALRLVRPLHGPAKHLVKMKLDHRNTAGTFIMTSHIAYVSITVTAPRRRVTRRPDSRQPDPRRPITRQPDPRRRYPWSPIPRRPDPRRLDPRQPVPRRLDPRRQDPRRLDSRRSNPRRQSPSG